MKDYFHLDLDPVDIEMRGSGAVFEPGGPLGQKSPWPKNNEGFLGEGMDEDVPYHGSVHFGRIGGSMRSINLRIVTDFIYFALRVACNDGD